MICGEYSDFFFKYINITKNQKTGKKPIYRESFWGDDRSFNNTIVLQKKTLIVNHLRCHLSFCLPNFFYFPLNSKFGTQLEKKDEKEVKSSMIMCIFI